ncbi:glutamate racemase [Candidatus Daviesbacteria bacterium]|nr:glutamate racemase [Candidatus Daviesbacteria bacterium]
MRNMKNNPIGIFDSGIGGLTIVKEIIKALPFESIIYLGDTARVPYGPRSKEVIAKFAKELAQFLLKRDVKCLVVACNTISATSLEEIVKISPVPVIGVVEPTIEAAVKTIRGKKIGVIGTAGTINSGVYEDKIGKLNKSIKVSVGACPLFVPLAEEGLGNHKATKIIAEGYLRGLKKKKIDTLILGCTHYPVLAATIQQIMGKQVKLVDSAKPTAQKLKQLLTEKELVTENRSPEYRFFVTDAPEKVIEVAGRFFGKGLDGNLAKINLPTL